MNSLDIYETFWHDARAGLRGNAVEAIFMFFRIIFLPFLPLFTLVRAWSKDWDTLDKRESELLDEYDKTYGPDFGALRAAGLHPPPEISRVFPLALSMNIADAGRRLRAAGLGQQVSSGVDSFALQVLEWEDRLLASGAEPLRNFVKALREFRKLTLEAAPYQQKKSKFSFLANQDARHRRIRMARFYLVYGIEQFKAEERRQ